MDLTESLKRDVLIFSISNLNRLSNFSRLFNKSSVLRAKMILCIVRFEILVQDHLKFAHGLFLLLGKFENRSIEIPAHKIEQIIRILYFDLKTSSIMAIPSWLYQLGCENSISTMDIQND